MDRRSAAEPAVTWACDAGAEVMRIGELSRRSGVPVRVLRRYADRGLIYSAGRSPADYRLFGEPALWCVQVISGLRALGLTVAEISQLAEIYLRAPGEPIGPHFLERDRVRLAVAARNEKGPIHFEAGHAAELGGDGFRAQDPLSGAAGG